MARLLNRFLGGILSYLTFLVPRRRTLWVFGSWFGRQFSDNSKYLFLYVSRSMPEVDAVWLSRDKRIVKEIRALGFRAHTLWSPAGVRASLRAGTTFISQSLDDVNAYLVGRSNLVQLWHGTPLKKIGLDSRHVI